MRKYVIAACVLTVCVLLVASVALAKAEVVKWESADQMWYNDCTGEILVFDVKGQLVWFIQKNGGHKFQTTIHGQGESDLGVKYRLNYSDSVHYKPKDPNNFVHEYSYKVRIIGQGPSNNSSVWFKVRITVVDGEVTSEFIKEKFDCNG